jgi:hypothetical protein
MIQHNAASTTGGPKDKGKKGGDEGDVNLEDLLSEISKEIFRIYKSALNPHADMHARNPLDLLTVRKMNFYEDNIGN